MKTIPPIRFGPLLIAATVGLSAAKLIAQPAITDVKYVDSGRIASHDGGRTWIDGGYSPRGGAPSGPTPAQVEEQRRFQEAEADKAEGVRLLNAGQLQAAHDYFEYALEKAPNDPAIQAYAQDAMRQIMAREQQAENERRRRAQEIAEQQRRRAEAERARSLAAEEQMREAADARAREDGAAADEQRRRIESLADALEAEPTGAPEAGERPPHEFMIRSSALAQAQGASGVWNASDLQTMNLDRMEELKNLVFDSDGPLGSGRLAVVDTSSGRRSAAPGPIENNPKIRQMVEQQAGLDQQYERLEASRKALLRDPTQFSPQALAGLLAKEGTVQGQRDMVRFRVREEISRMADIPRFVVP